ncbi:MAG: GNVR domain-containing protein, partial [Candidatus Paceibacterota bacterium]
LLLRYSRLYREVEIQNTIYELLIPQLEQQKLFLANKSSGIRVIDPADLPTYKHSPKRAFIVLGGFFFAIFLSLFVVFIRELREDENSEYSQKMDKLLKELSFTSSES